MFLFLQLDDWKSTEWNSENGNCVCSLADSSDAELVYNIEYDYFEADGVVYNAEVYRVSSGNRIMPEDGVDYAVLIGQ